MKWKSVPGGSFYANGLRGTYRIVHNSVVSTFNLRLEVPDQPHDWMGMFPTLERAREIAQNHDVGERRLRAWDRYMRENDPPTRMGPEWQV